MASATPEVVGEDVLMHWGISIPVLGSSGTMRVRREKDAAGLGPAIGAAAATRPEMAMRVDATEGAMAPVLTADQYKVRRTSVELPVRSPIKAPASASPAKSPRFDYGSPSELAPKSAPRKARDLFPAP